MELCNNDKGVIKFIEETTDIAINRWRYCVGIPTLKPRGELIKFYVNGELQLVS
tara:strand:- start:281 stop:442 length:162 start_codon:yes stop_codon:yes gene_type:complete